MKEFLDGVFMEMSACQQLDVSGMQPHAREYLEYEVLRDRSHFKGAMVPGVLSAEESYDRMKPSRARPSEGIQYTDRP
jgi:hypothetical protein